MVAFSIKIRTLLRFDLKFISVEIMLSIFEEFYFKFVSKLMYIEFSLIMTDISQHETLVAPTLEKGKRKQVMIWFLCQAIIFDKTKSSFKIFSPPIYPSSLFSSYAEL